MLAERIFARLQALWGTKFLQLWRGADMAEVFATWDHALQGVSPDRIMAALRDCETLDQPPTLPVFIRMCREQPTTNVVPLRVGYAGPVTTPEQARQNLARIQAALAEFGQSSRRDPLHWARHPKSLHAVLLMVQGAQRHPALREILRGHVEDAGERIQTDDGIKAFVAALERDQSLLTPLASEEVAA